MRAWLAARGVSWVTPRRLRWMTGSLLALALTFAAIGFGLGPRRSGGLG